MSCNTSTATVKASEVGMQWGQGNMKQGMPQEDYVGKSLPADARLPQNFKTFDYYDGATKTAAIEDVILYVDNSPTEIGAGLRFVLGRCKFSPRPIIIRR